MTITVDSLANVVHIGQTQLGVGYGLGSAAGRSSWGAAKQALFDCSGFVAWTYFQATGVKLPGYTDALAKDSRLTQVSAPSVGDIVLFHFPYGGAEWGHTAIYAGNGTVLESGSADGSRSAVNIMPLLGGSYKPEFFHLKGVTESPTVVTPLPGDPLPTPAPKPGTFDPTLPSTPLEGGTTVGAGGLPGTKLGQIGPWAVNIPSGLVLGLLGALLLLLGALLFAFNVKVDTGTA